MKLVYSIVKFIGMWIASRQSMPSDTARGHTQRLVTFEIVYRINTAVLKLNFRFLSFHCKYIIISVSLIVIVLSKFMQQFFFHPLEHRFRTPDTNIIRLISCFRFSIHIYVHTWNTHTHLYDHTPTHARAHRSTLCVCVHLTVYESMCMYIYINIANNDIQCMKWQWLFCRTLVRTTSAHQN